MAKYAVKCRKLNVSGDINMAKKVKLSVYGMQVRKNGVDNQDLNNLFNGKDIISIVYEYIDQHINTYDNDRNAESLFAFSHQEKKEIYEDGQLVYKTLSGIIKTGDYGISSELIDINTGESYSRTSAQADTMPFGFCIIVPAGNVNSCIIVMQSLGQYGIKMALQKRIQNILQKLDSNLFISLGPVMPKQYVQRYLEKGILQKISMTRFEIPEDETERIGVNYGVEQTYEERIIHKPIGFLERKKDAIREWVNGQKKSTEIIQLNDFEYDNLKFTFKLGNNDKTINLDNLDKIVVTEDVTDKVQIIEGHPTFASLKPVMIEIGSGYLQGVGLIHE